MCIIALIEIGCCKLVSEPWSVLSQLVFFDFTVCTRMVLDYLWYLLWFSIHLGGFEHSGGVTGCFRFVESGKGRYVWLQRLSWLWLVLSVLLILDFVCKVVEV